MAEFTTRWRMECENFGVEVYEDQVSGHVTITAEVGPHMDPETLTFTRPEFEALCDLRYKLRWEKPAPIAKAIAALPEVAP